MTRWRSGLALTALCWLAGQAAAASLRVEALGLEHAAAWQRGSGEQEEADGVFILDHRGDAAEAAQVMLLRRAPVIRTDAGTYFEQIGRFWHATYGRAVLVDWMQAGDVKWRYVRRPASENGLGVFQLVTVFDGRAYSLLVFVPGTATTLPAPARALLAGIRFGAPAADAGVAATPPPRWRLARTYRLKPSGEALEAAANADAGRLGLDGMLTGYGFDYGEASAAWFMEGFVWRPGPARPERVPWSSRGRLEVEAPAEWSEAAPWSLRLTLPEGEGGVSARLAVWTLCASQAELDGALEELDRGVRLPMERLAERCAAARPASPAASLQGEAGKTVAATWVLPARTPTAPPGADEAAGVRLVEAVLETAPERTLPGEGLLRRIRLFFAYLPAR